MRTFAAAFLLLQISAWTWADEPAYVTDRIEVHVRAGKGIHYKILRQLRSGAPVTVLEHDSKSGYSKVRLRDGTEGWILTRYLSKEPSSRWKLKVANAELEKIKAENARIKQELEALKKAQGQLSSEKLQLNQRSEALESEMQRIRHAAAHALEIEDERNRLRERVATLERDLEHLKLENQALSHEGSKRWFLIGAGVLAGGIVLGLLLPRLGWRRKRSWNSLSSL